MNNNELPKLAALQMCSSTNVDENLAVVKQQLDNAGPDVKLVVLPENVLCMGQEIKPDSEITQRCDNGEIPRTLSAIAKKHNVILVCGSLPFTCEDKKRVHSRCLVFDETGTELGNYDKIHLFDVDLPEKKESYRESDSYQHGSQIKVFDTSIGKVGVAICYDLRFPEQFRLMADQDAEIICIPSAFTQTTGEAHWEVLLRARAIENQCYIVASNQTGKHANSRETFGHSMVIDSWGSVLDIRRKGNGLAKAEFNQPKQDELRKTFPVLTHRRL